MSNKNDRWSALSMKERADLMNMYITNGISDLKEMKRHYNSFSGEEDTNKSFWQKLLESGQSTRDARVGAVGAQQVRDLYSEGKTEEAQELAKKYAKANTTGIALASGAATSSLLGDLAVTGVTTTADTLIDGDINNFGKNFLYNAAADIVGHGAGKAVDKVAKTIKATKLAKALNNTKLDDSNLAYNVGVESKIIPLEAKSVALQDAIAFEDALKDLNRTEQIKRFNAFAKKYGYEEIGESVSDEVLDKATKEMLERHNTYFRGVRPSEEVTNLATKLGISEEEALKIAATTPRAGETHVYVSPTNNAGIYGGGEYVAQVRRPYELGNDRTQWFNEANFEITPGMYSNGNEYVIDPWFSLYKNTPEVPNELLIKKGEFVDWVKGDLEGKGSNNKIFTKYNKLLEIYEPEDLAKFDSGGKLNIFSGEENTNNTPWYKKLSLFLTGKKDVDFSNIKTTGNRKYNPKLIKYINEQLDTMDINRRAVILGDIIEESGGNPFAKSENGTYQGLLQWGADRYRIPENQTDTLQLIDNQLKYIIESSKNTKDGKSWTHGGKGSGYNSLIEPYNIFWDNDSTLEDKHKAFSFGYVRPKGKNASEQNRLKVVKQVVEKLK